MDPSSWVSKCHFTSVGPLAWMVPSNSIGEGGPKHPGGVSSLGSSLSVTRVTCAIDCGMTGRLARFPAVRVTLEATQQGKPGSFCVTTYHQDESPLRPWIVAV